MDRESHLDANEYKFLCSQANEMSKKENLGKTTSNGWYVTDNKYDKKTNFKAVLYQKGDESILCYVGTDRFSAKDWSANIKMAVTGGSAQIELAKKFAQDMISKHNLSLSNLISIGHSEGGTEATEVGIANGLKTVTFNAYGVSKKHVDASKISDGQITNYRDPHDPVSKLRANVGETYITPSTQSQFMSKTPFGSVQSHGISNMGDCDNAVPVNFYKKTHPTFIDKISEKAITRKDIAEMPSEVFAVFESEIDKRLAKNKIKLENSKNLKWVTINGNHVPMKK